MVEASPVGGALAIDDTTFPKKGKCSVGVTHQYCGELGKRANCQAFVTAEYVAEGPSPSTPMHWPVSGRLFLPDDWISDEERRRAAHVPAEVQKRSKIEIALDLIDRATLWNVPFRLVTADAAYGHFRGLLPKGSKNASGSTPARSSATSACAAREEPLANEVVLQKGQLQHFQQIVRNADLVGPLIKNGPRPEGWARTRRCSLGRVESRKETGRARVLGIRWLGKVAQEARRSCFPPFIPASHCL